MKLGTIENNSHNTLEVFLKAAAKDASALDWASAFITSSGLNAVHYLLTAAAKKGKVRILTGLYQGFTEPAALRPLLKAQSASRGGFEVRISKEPHFHWKAYFVFGKQSVRFVVGSSNLTSDGLGAGGEFNVTLTMPKNSSDLKSVHGLFEKHWHHQSAPLSEQIVDAYSRWYEKAGGKARKRTVPLKAILGKQKTVAHEATEISYYRCSIEGTYTDATDDLLAKTTNWDKRGYDSFNDAKPYRTGDRVILFDFVDNRVKVVMIADTTRTPIRTHDGVYFAAHKLSRGTKARKWTTKRRESLKAAGLISGKADATVQRKLKQSQFQAFVDNLKKTV